MVWEVGMVGSCGMVVCACLLGRGRCFLYGEGDRKNVNVGVYMEKRDMDLQSSIKSRRNSITINKNGFVAITITNILVDNAAIWFGTSITTPNCLHPLPSHQQKEGNE